MRLETWRAMAAQVGDAESDKPVRSLGVCNFSVRQLEELVMFCDQNMLARPAVVQNECHPLLPALPVRAFCAKEGIVFQAYASLGAGSLGLIDDGTVQMLAKKHGVQPGQVLLKWALQKGCAVLPKSVKPERQRTNLQLHDWSLDDVDIKLLDEHEDRKPDCNTLAGWLREHDPDHY